MELPNTKHAFCIWHIVAKIPTWFSSHLGLQYNDFKFDFHRLYNLECTTEFEEQWESMVKQFNLSTNNHIQLLYQHRQLGLIIFEGLFFCWDDNNWTFRIYEYTSLVDFVNQVGVAVNIRNQCGEEARMRQKYYNPQIRTGFLIEEHAATILTPYAFELLQHEIQLSTKYPATKYGNDYYIVHHHTKFDGGRFVTWREEKDSITCSCKEFEFSGILCRHVIRVMLKNDYFNLPDKYSSGILALLLFRHLD
ncbi:hypothetical protein Lal_00024091 [Lupinus albus]|nr:hypothetical protein Lal_00024091 [Lupinus albus]